MHRLICFKEFIYPNSTGNAEIHLSFLVDGFSFRRVDSGTLHLLGWGSLSGLLCWKSNFSGFSRIFEGNTYMFINRCFFNWIFWLFLNYRITESNSRSRWLKNNDVLTGHESTEPSSQNFRLIFCVQEILFSSLTSWKNVLEKRPGQKIVGVKSRC